MPRADQVEALVQVQVTFEVPERGLQWAISQATRHVTQRNLDHVIAILVSSQCEANVVAVKLPKGEE